MRPEDITSDSTMDVAETTGSLKNVSYCLRSSLSQMHTSKLSSRLKGSRTSQSRSTPLSLSIQLRCPCGIVRDARVKSRVRIGTHGRPTKVLTTLLGSFSSRSWGAHIVTSVRTNCFGETRSTQPAAIVSSDLTALGVRWFF